ncbi:MAG TPA: CopG family transcriptional regulator [Chloroflexota bacterium]|nr:CopG family transcriptional regulator [Chloroflexota bacterium]
MYRTNIYLDPEQVRALKHLAAEENCSLAELIRRAIDQYIANRAGDDATWHERLDAFLARVREGLPRDVSPEEIEADITAAREEVRQLHREPSRR